MKKTITVATREEERAVIMCSGKDEKKRKSKTESE